MFTKNINENLKFFFIGIIFILMFVSLFSGCVEEEGEPPEDYDYLILRIYPDEYPELYEEWDIEVWKVKNGTYYPGDNVTITIEIFDYDQENNKTVYVIYTDFNGVCEYRYTEQKNHTFTASAIGFVNDSLLLKQPKKEIQYEDEDEYVDPSSMDYFTTFFPAVSLPTLIPFLLLILKIKKELDPIEEISPKVKKLLLNISMVIAFSYIVVSFVGFYLGFYELKKYITPDGLLVGAHLVIMEMVFLVAIALIISFTLLIAVSIMLIIKSKKKS